MRPKTTAMQRTSDMEGGGGGGGFGKTKAPLPPAAKHCTTITVTANGQRSSPDSPSLSQVSNRRSVEMTEGKKPQRAPSVKSSQAPPPPSPSPALPRSPAATVNGHSRRNGSDGSSSTSSGSVHAAETDFYSSLPDLLPEEEIVLPLSSTSSPSPPFQHSSPSSPATSGYCSPLPSPKTGSSAGRRSLVRQQQQQQLNDGQDTLSNSSFSNNEGEEDDVATVLLPPPAQFGDDEGVRVDDHNDEADNDDGARHHHHRGGPSPGTRQSPPPSPPLDYTLPEARGGPRSGKPRPFSETDVAQRHRAEARASGPSLSSQSSVSSSSSSKLSAVTRTVSCPGPDALPKEVFHMHVRTTAMTPLGTVPENHAEVVVVDPQRAFAGRRDVRDLQHMQEKEIVSVRGSVRGFKNRVRAGISTFLDTRTNKFNYLELEKGKIVVYTTSMTVVRETYDRCKVARNILQTHMVRYEERDLYMSHEHQRQLAERLDVEHSKAVRLPQIFIDGVHIGGATQLEKLNETGELRQVLDSFPKIQVRTMCSNCGGYRFVPCVVCHGSKKSVHRNNFTEEFCALRCMHCNENGLQRCQSCLDQQE